VECTARLHLLSVKMATVASHSRKPSSRSAMPRRSTRGPLDASDDPLSGAMSQEVSSQPTTVTMATPSFVTSEVGEVSLAPEVSNGPLSSSTTMASTEDRDLSFLLEPSIYHALSQVEVPTPFRKPFLPPPTTDTPLASSLHQLDKLLGQCDFLRAAHFAASVLLSSTIRPTDMTTIFRLLEIRYSCLELSSNLLLAAQEAKALEDLSSGFYYDNLNDDKPDVDDAVEEQPRKLPQHIMPFSLRLQALRLQSIGFSDPRRGISTLYDVASECREQLYSPSTTEAQREMWTSRLQEVSIRVVNALIEMGDLDCAARTLETVKPKDNENMLLWTSRMLLLRIKMGDITKAEKLLSSSNLEAKDKSLLSDLLSIADGKLDDAIEALSDLQTTADSSTADLIRQNLAVAYLYRGEVHKALKILEELLESNQSYQTLTVNLATLYDLTSDRSRELKSAMISKVATQQKNTTEARWYTNADFKL
jgi:trafficking protein particle complex subunit 12